MCATTTPASCCDVVERKRYTTGITKGTDPPHGHLCNLCDKSSRLGNAEGHWEHTDAAIFPAKVVPRNKVPAVYQEINVP